MAILLEGKPVAESIKENLVGRAEDLRKQGAEPTLAIFRVGDDKDKRAYERGAVQRAEQVGIRVKSMELKEDVSQYELESKLGEACEDSRIHGIMILEPLPEHIDKKRILEIMEPAKDVDGATYLSMAGVYSDEDYGYPPCTAEACVELMDFYGIDLAGKNVVVIGRSLVVGKPLAMMLLGKNATVTICHSKTEDIKDIAWNADILVVAIGKADAVGRDFVRENQVVIDVGINMNGEGKLTGDVSFEDVEDAAKAITPVPGGVGSVTNIILMKHVVEAAEKSLEDNLHRG